MHPLRLIIMQSKFVWLAYYFLFTIAHAAVSADPYNYRNINRTYSPQKETNITTLQAFVKSRSDLSILATELEKCGGFVEAFDTTPTWKFTFFAPNNNAFNNTGEYFTTKEVTPKGKWWIGNTIINHYVPNTILKTSAFSEEYQRFQTASFLYVGAQVVGTNKTLTLNNVANVVEGDLEITEGVVHIIDKILDPSAQIYESDSAKISQAFIPGSCSNLNLPYC
ncbi:hypothetical protein BGW36DRAFT_369602, partial [Talaromyces proteolyticus]